MTAQRTFIEDARTWLAERAPSFEEPSGQVATFPRLTPAEHDDQIACARSWEHELHTAGYAGLSLPCEVGGMGRSIADAVAFSQAEAEYALPLDVFTVTRGMVLPTLIRWADPALLAARVRPALKGEALWCQLFSEPNTGSDLAALRLRGTREGDAWRLNGTKVWTSYGHVADVGYVHCAGTGPLEARHRALTAFVVDLSSDGVHRMPIQQATGGTSFAEVTFDDVVVPDAQRLGDVDGGWAVAMTTLTWERVSIGPAQVPWPQYSRMASGRGGVDMRVLTGYVTLRLLQQQAVEGLDGSSGPGPEGSITKIIAARTNELIAEVIGGQGGIGSLVDGGWSEFVLGVSGLKLGGGTEDILRTMLAERVLGLPRA